MLASPKLDREASGLPKRNAFSDMRRPAAIAATTRSSGKNRECRTSLLRSWRRRRPSSIGEIGGDLPKGLQAAAPNLVSETRHLESHLSR